VERKFTILDERGNWFGPAMKEALHRGYQTTRIMRGADAEPGGLGFIRPHAIPHILQRNHADFLYMREKMAMVQDFDQVQLYDDKSAQFWRYGHLMPKTWRFENKDLALKFINAYNGTLVSKADVGASSKNVRILPTRSQQTLHAMQVFGKGVEVDHCAGGHGTRHATSKQKGYLLLQEHVPHQHTWRVNAVGRGRAIFKRFNGPDGKAQTGNVEPVKELNEETYALLHYANQVFAELDTRWCALDILAYGVNEWRLLETSLGWPWPSPGDCDNAPFFNLACGATPYVWRDMWKLMFDEYEAGTWDTSNRSAWR
jgi:hypothetical protein